MNSWLFSVNFFSGYLISYRLFYCAFLTPNFAPRSSWAASLQTGKSQSTCLQYLSLICWVFLRHHYRPLEVHPWRKSQVKRLKKTVITTIWTGAWVHTGTLTIPFTICKCTTPWAGLTPLPKCFKTSSHSSSEPKLIFSVLAG